MSTLFTRSLLCLALLGSILAGLFPASVYAQRIEPPAPVVHAILFYSPTCPHCHQVIQNDLPPLMKQYGDQLQIIGIDVTQESGQMLYQNAVAAFGISEDRRGVPCLIVGNVVMVGSDEIPALFPGLIEKQLTAGGVDWPAIPGLQSMLVGMATPQPTTPAQTAAPAAAPAPTVSAAPVSAEPVPVDIQPLAVTSWTWRDRFMQDAQGNSLALLVLAGMVLGLIWALRPLVSKTVVQPSAAQISWRIPMLGLLGLGVAAYLTYIESSQALAICGPVGDCNTVQQSAYARLFGIPIAVFGMAGYMAILGMWAARRWGHGILAEWATDGLFAVAVTGVLFSAYLTFLEPFVIGATCMWCLSSAVIMTAILLLSASPGRQERPSA